MTTNWCETLRTIWLKDERTTPLRKFEIEHMTLLEIEAEHYRIVFIASLAQFGPDAPGTLAAYEQWQKCVNVPTPYDAEWWQKERARLIGVRGHEITARRTA